MNLQNTIIAGPQGSGKSTLLDLILKDIQWEPFNAKPYANCQAFVFENVNDGILSTIHGIITNGFTYRPDYSKKEVTIKPVIFIETQDLDFTLPYFKRIIIEP